ncbi:MAG: hypothetical protein ACOYN4_07785 [Bacteroidales bacterium]
MTVFVEERTGKTEITSKIGQEQSRKTSPKRGTKFRAGRASATNLQPAKLDKSAKNRNIYAENLNSGTG